MCGTCYEGYGSPSIVNDRTRHGADLAAKVYEFSAVGGNAHIVLDDWNIEDGHIRWCLDNALPENFHESSEAEIAATRECLDAFAAMSIPERASALAILDGLIEVE